jgi:carboxymethylenebutenolidase
MNRLSRGAVVALLLVLAASIGHAADISGERILLPAKERQVHVTYFRASGEGSHPAVLILHGAGGFDRQIENYNHYASALAGQGIDAYLVYYYSDLDEKNLASGANVFEERYAAWAKLVDDLADYLQKQKTSNGKIGLIGFSNGGILATGASSLDPNITAAVIYYGTEPWPLKMPAKRFPPLLVLHGDADQVIPVEAGKHLAEVAKGLGGQVDLVIYPGEKHGFGSNTTNKDGADALNRTITFLRRELAVN